MSGPARVSERYLSLSGVKLRGTESPGHTSNHVHGGRWWESGGGLLEARLQQGGWVGAGFRGGGGAGFMGSQ